MTVSNYHPIVGTAGKIFVHTVELDQVAVTTADSTAWTITDALGTTISSGTLTYVTPLPVDNYDTLGGWYANITWPTVPGKCHVHMTITKSSAVMKWHEYVTVEAFTP